LISILADSLKKNYSDFEIWQERRITKSFEQTANGVVIDQVSKTETAVRVFSDGRVGFAFLSGEQLDTNRLTETLNFSLQNSFKDSDNLLPELTVEKRSFGSFKDDIAKASVLDIFGLMREESSKMKHIKQIERLFLSDEKIEVTLFNSKNGFLEQKLNKVSLGSVIIVEKDGEEKVEWDFSIDEKLEHLDGKKVLDTAYNRALKILNSSPTYTGKYPILLETRAATEFLEVLVKSFLAENVFKKRSIITEGVCFSNLLNIAEEPLLSCGSRSFYFDGEGYTAYNKDVVKNGEVKELLYDSLYGRKFGKKSSANAVRTRVSSPPQNGYSNIYIKSGNCNMSEVVKNSGTVICITSLIGMHLVNPVSGEVSVGFEGYLLQNGEYKKALSNMILAGNLKQLFQNIIAVGDDLSFYGSVGSPSILVEGMSVTGI